MRILLVEDDHPLGASLQRAVEHAGHLVEWVTSAEMAREALRQGDFDLMILDWSLPGESGLSLLKALRSNNYAAPVLMLTARVGVEQKVAGLDAGADDYLTKPFDLDELIARIRALSRRRTVKPNLVICAGEMSLNPENGELDTINGSIKLSKNEIVIMEALLQNAGRYVSKPRLEELISHWDEPVSANAIEAQISRLRKRLGKGVIHTLRGVGYKVDKA